MVRRNLMGLMIGAMLLCAVSVAWAGVPDLNTSSAATAAPTLPASVYNLPNGGGHAINNCWRSGGVRQDATITLTLLDVNSNPVFQYPWSDMWLDTGDGRLVYCAAGTAADRDTDTAGQTVWTRALRAGCDGIGTAIIVNGNPLNRAPLNINHNSADLDCNLAVNLTDMTQFTAALFGGTYRYRIDYFYDGINNLADFILFSQGIGAICP